MGFLYEATSFTGWAIWLFVLFALMAFNELRSFYKMGRNCTFSNCSYSANYLCLANDCSPRQ